MKNLFRLLPMQEGLLSHSLSAPEAEHSQALMRLNATQRPYPQLCVHKLFEQQAERTPAHLALVQQDQRLTYEELNSRANRLADYLRKSGIGPEVRVGIGLHRSVEAIVAMVAVLKAGGAYVPLDPEYPVERLALLLEEAQIKLLLSEQRVLPRLPQSRVPVVCLDDLRVDSYSAANFSGQEGPENIAYVMYTSGSTGKPKGVAAVHRGIVRLLFGVDYVRLGKQETILQLAPLGFDASTLEVWGALLHGGRLVLYPKEALGLERLEEVLKEEKVTCLWLTASLFNLIIDSRPEMLKEVRQVLTGGEALSLAHIDRALERLPETEIINGYGPTEGTTFTCCYRIPRPRPQAWESVPIGRPIANTQVLVLDSAGWPSADGMPGELYIGGDGLARGYLNSPESTAQYFVPDAFSGCPGGRLYASGDLVRWRADGVLEFLGRRDDQVKIRGFRIEPAEVESILRRQQGVCDGAVIVHTDDRKEKRLIGYVVLEPGTTTVSSVQASLRKLLPEYMVPSVLISLDSLPLTPNGKLDRAALPVPAGTTEGREQKCAPRTPVEKVLARIWSEVLRIGPVSCGENFFELGGNSLRGMQVVSRIREAFNVLIPLRHIFEHTTIASLATCIGTAMRDCGGSRLPPVSRGTEIPLGLSQERVWFLRHLDPSSIAYNFQATLHINGPLNVPALERSLTEMVKRHEILRTTFMEKDGQPIQLVHEPVPASFKILPLRGMEKRQRDEAAEKIIQDEAARRFDASRLPLIRWILLSFGEDENLLLHLEDHLVHDGWSFNLFLGELLELYKAFASGQPSPLLPLRFQFADFAIWQQEYVRSDEVQAQRAYWKEKLAGSPSLSELPTDHPRSTVQTFHGGLLRVPLSTTLSKRLRAFSNQEDTSLFVVMMSAFFALAYQYTRQPDFCVGTSLANRQRTETEGLLGMLVNNVVLRAHVPADAGFRDLLLQVRDLTFEAYENQDVPFHEVVKSLNVNRDLSVNPLFQTMFNFHNSPVSVPEIPELKLRLQEAVGNGAAKFDLGVIVIPASPQRLRLNPEWDKDAVTMLWEYNTDLFEEQTIRQMIGDYEQILQSMIFEPTQKLAEICLLNGEGRQRMIVNWNQDDKEVHELVGQKKSPAPGRIDPAFNDEHGDRLTPTQELLAGIWASVLKLKHVGIHENFFELGGHSLLSMQVISRIRQICGVSLQVHDLFECPEIRSLAARIDAGKGRPGEAQIPIRTVERQGTLPLSFAQRRLWFLQQFGVGESTYNIPIALRLGGELDVAALERAIGEIVGRHEVLRTTLSENPNPGQVIHAPEFVELPVVEVQGLIGDEREQEVKRLVQEEARGGFDLIRERPIRVRLVRVEERQHLLLVTLHHIASDAWSLQVFMRELAVLYGAYSQGQESPLEGLRIQYADYAVWQQEMLQGAVLDEQMSYWKKQLAGMAEMLELPVVRPRPPVQTYAGAQYRFRIGGEVADSVQDASRSHGVTLFMTLLAVFQVLLHRYSGQEDIAIGTPIAGRNRVELEVLIGFFVNTLVLRGQMAGGMRFQELLRQVRERALAAYASQDLPFEKLVEELQPERDLSRTPLFQVWFSLQNQPAVSWSLPGLELRAEEITVSEVKFDLSLAVEEAGPGLQCVLSYRTDLFEGGAMVRMGQHYQRLLEAAVGAAETAIGELPLLTGGEATQILEEWNQTGKSYPQQRCIHELFEEQVQRDPVQIAVLYESWQLTYEELNRRANQFARYLRRKGIGTEDRVGVCMERSVEMVIALLGILKAGGAYVPMDAEYPRDRLAYMMQDAGIAVLVTQSGVATALEGAEAKCEVICMDGEREEISRETCDNPVFAVTPENLAYVIYTSGSTGVPKGVANEHRGVVNHLRWLQETYPLSSRDRSMQKTPYSFDVSAPEFFWTLMTGAALVVARPGGHKEPDYMVDLMAGQEITTMRFVPSMLQAFLESRGLERCASLKRVICSGEALPVSAQDYFLQRMAGVELINAYGPTEAAVEVTHWLCRAGQAPVPIGRPALNTQLYILDQSLQAVPVEVAGELYIAGVQVARGYWNRPELTAEKFVPNPFALVVGQRMYRTGDRARWNREGAVEFLGRLDHQVKLRGFRIELGEIEAVLRQHEAVQEAVVVVRGSEAEEKRLVCYYTRREGRSAVEASSLRAHVQQKLPDYMIPTAFVELESWPRTGSGKIDRKLLPAPEKTVAGARYVSPRTEVEELLAGIWSQVLNVPHIGAHENFFELGGHSLLAIRLISRIRDVFHAEIDLRSLFAGPTIAHLAQIIERELESGESDSDAIAACPELPLSYNQEGRLLREWFAEVRGMPQPPFHVVLGLDWIGNFDLPCLEGAINQVVQRHQVLRTAFIKAKGTASSEVLSVIGPVVDREGMNHAMGKLLEVAPRLFRQAVCAPAPLKVDIKDLQHLSAERQASEIAGIVSREIRIPFDYEKPPLMRAVVLRMGPQQHRLILTVHHMVTDFWSVNILIRELSVFYQSLAGGFAPCLPGLPVQYSDFAAWQRNRLQGRRMAALTEYWRKQWLNIELLDVRDLPFEKVRTAEPSSAAQRLTFDQAFCNRLKKFTWQRGATTYMLFLASLYSLLHLLSGKRKIGIWGQFANRTRTETENLIGWFANLHPLGIELDPEMPAGEVVDKVRNSVLEAHAHQEIPFSLVWATALQELNVQLHTDDRGFSPFIVVDFHPMASNLDVANGPDVRRVSLPFQPIQGVLRLLVWDENDGMGIAAHYATQIFSSATTRQLLSDLERIMDLIVTAPDMPLGDFSPLLPSQVQIG